MHLVNAIAPYILNARLKPLMVATAGRHKHVVNVSAMEGQFYRTTKTDKHPHTNMAKAALNMMTRTSAPDFVKDGIHMNAVDTGWVTDEDPAVHAARKAELGFSPPLDIIDGAARIVDPIFVGRLTGEHVVGTVSEGLQAGGRGDRRRASVASALARRLHRGLFEGDLHTLAHMARRHVDFAEQKNQAGDDQHHGEHEQHRNRRGDVERRRARRGTTP